MLYCLTADEVKATLQVATSVPTPMCLISGEVKNLGLEGSERQLLIQLIGWVPWGKSCRTSNSMQFFALDKQPGSAHLAGLYESNKEVKFVLVACGPEIKLCD